MNIIAVIEYECGYCDKRFKYIEKAEKHEKKCKIEQDRTYKAMVKILNELEVKCDCAEME